MMLITTLVVSFCKDGGVRVSVNLWFLVVCVRYEVVCRFVQSTNETHYTQQNTTITTHKRSQLLILTETRYQLQQTDKEVHTQHTHL